MAKPEDIVAFLGRVPLFQGLNDRQLKQLAKRFIARTYRPNDHIVTQGKGGEGMFTIVSGHAEAVLETEDGEKIVVETFKANDFFGEITLLDDGPRTASVVATEETECLVLSRWEFLALLKNDAEMGAVIAQVLAKRLRKLINTLDR